MAYNPPDKSKNELFYLAYRRGYFDAKNSTPYRGDELYPPSNHERDFAFDDELNYHYYEGFMDYSAEN